jgi:hypothetical protein
MFWKTIKNFWYIPVFALIALVLFVAQRRKLAARLLRVELEASKAAQEAARNKIELGAELATKQVLIDHNRKLRQLRGKQRTRVSELMDDPEALSRYLVKLNTDQ